MGYRIRSTIRFGGARRGDFGESREQIQMAYRTGLADTDDYRGDEDGYRLLHVCLCCLEVVGK